MKRFLVMAIGGVGAAVCALAAAGLAEAGGGCRGKEATVKSGDTVEMTDQLCFLPTVLYVDPGSEVTFENLGSQPHSVTGANAGWGDYEPIGEVQQRRFRFESAGTYAFYCFLHNGMIGTIVVGDGKGDGGAVAAKAAESDATGNNDGALPGWGIAAGAALTGMVATGAAGVAIGRRKP